MTEDQPIRLFRDFSAIPHSPLMKAGDKITVTTPHGTWEGVIMPNAGVTGEEAEESVERLAVSLRAYGEQTGRPEPTTPPEGSERVTGL